MMTATTALPTSSYASLRRTRTSDSATRRCPPRPRTAIEFLQALAGADSTRFPHFPRRRIIP